MEKQILVAMSGGVDSAVAAATLVQQGHLCIGATMRLSTGKAGTCGSGAEAEDARRVAEKLHIPHKVFDFSADFEKQVIERFCTAYQQGKTPNPCIDCNRYMKFQKLYEQAKELGCDKVATGHYARVRYDEKSGRWQLLRARCLEKDQSYVLYTLSQEQLAASVFPLGEMESKGAVREKAAALGFENADKPDSQDICFVPDGDYAAFLEEHTGETAAPGDFVDGTGRVLGRHRGLIRYTVGQRKGLGLSLPAPLYVCEKRVEDNTVVLGEEQKLFKIELFATDFNWIACDPPKEPLPVTVMTRYRAREVAGDASVLPDGRVHIRCSQPVRAVTPGQAVVLYDGDRVVGGGKIL